MIKFTCPNCDANLKASEEKAGATIACPQCKTRLDIPNASGNSSSVSHSSRRPMRASADDRGSTDARATSPWPWVTAIVVASVVLVIVAWLLTRSSRNEPSSREVAADTSKTEEKAPKLPPPKSSGVSKKDPVPKESAPIAKKVPSTDPFERGVEAMNRNDVDSAIAEFTAAIKLNPGNAAAFECRGFCFFQKGDLETAHADLTTSIKLSDRSKTAFLARAEVFIAKNDLDQAESDCSAAIRLDASDIRSVMKRGIIRHRNKRYANAIDDFTTAIQIDPSNVMAYKRRAAAAYDLDLDVAPFAFTGNGQPYPMYDKTIADLGQVIRLAPKDVEARLERGRLHWLKGMVKLAADDCTEALKLDDKRIEAYAIRARAREALGEYDPALGDYTQVIQMRDTDDSAFGGRASVYSAKQDFSRALADYATAIRLNPKCSTYPHRRAFIYYKQAEYDKALADYSEAIRLNPRNNPGFGPPTPEILQASLSHFGRGKVYEAKKMDEEAIKDFSKAIVLNPSSALFYAERAQAYRRTNQLSLAAADEEMARQFAERKMP